jgi:hypothetical protein
MASNNETFYICYEFCCHLSENSSVQNKLPGCKSVKSSVRGITPTGDQGFDTHGPAVRSKDGTWWNGMVIDSGKLKYLKRTCSITTVFLMLTAQGLTLGLVVRI